MVSNVPFVLQILADYSQTRSEMAAVQGEVDNTVRGWSLAKAKIKQEIGGIMRTMYGVVGTYRAMLTYFNISLDPIQESIIVGIQTSLMAAMTIHREMEAATLGLAGVVTIGLSLISIAMAAQAVMMATMGMDDARAQTQKSITLMTNMQATISTMTWFG